MEEVKRYMVVCDQAACDLLTREIVEAGQPKPRSSEMRGLGGEIVEFVVAGTIGINAVTALLELIAAAIKLGRAVKTVKLDDREIASPTVSDIEKLKQEVASK